MRHTARTLASVLFTAALATAPAWAGVHYTSTTETVNSQAGKMTIQVEGWASGNNSRVEFKNSDNPILKAGSYMITKDGGKTLYLVNPEDKTYAKWDIQGMMGAAGSVLKGMGPLFKMEISDPKVEKLDEGDGGPVLGIPTKRYKYRTSYNMKIRVMGMGNVSDVVMEQDIWATDRLTDLGVGAWLRAEPPSLGYEPFDKLMKSELGKISGYPLKMVTVTTTTPQKRGEKTVDRSTMEVTKLDTSATVAASRFEIPAGYQETQLLPTGPGAQADDGSGQQEEQSGLGGLLRRKKKDGGE